MQDEPPVQLKDLQAASILAVFADEPWLAILRLSSILESMARQGSTLIDAAAWIHPSATVRNSLVQAGAMVYEGATVRDSIILSGATVGHCSEVARSIVGTNAMIPRMNYVGSSLLGVGVQLGGAAMLASRRHDRQPIKLHWGVRHIDLGVDQFGSIIGDGSVVAYGSHLNPGTVIAHDAWIMPHADLHGYTPAHTVTRTRARVTRFAKPRDTRIDYEDSADA